MKNEISKNAPPPVLTERLFPPLLEDLLELLQSLTPSDWDMQVPRKRWSVKDVALHLLGVDVGLLSRERDGYVVSRPATGGYDALVAFLKTQNHMWVETTRRISARLLCDLLQFTGDQVSKYVQSLDPYALAGSVSWAGSDAVPNWFQVAREFTERWHHQQHIREAAVRPGCVDVRYLRPALATFVRALPWTYRTVEAGESATVQVTISGDAGDCWLLVREQTHWRLYTGPTRRADATVTIPQDVAWKRFTKWITKEHAVAASRVEGNHRLAMHVFDMIAVIA